MDANNWINDKLNDWFVVKNYSSVDDWLGSDWQSGLGTSGVFLALKLSLWLAVKEFVDWLRSSGNVPSTGSVSTPVTQRVFGGYTTSVVVNNVSYPDIPVYVVGSLTYMGQFSSNHVYTLDIVPDIPLSSSLFGNTFTISAFNLSHTYTFRAVSGGYALYVATNISYYPISVFSGSASGYNVDTSYPFYLIFVSESVNSGLCVPAIYYRGFDHLNHIALAPNWAPPRNGGELGTYNYTSSLNVSSVGDPSYQFNQVDPIYINLQIGELQSSLSALNDFLVALNQNLVSYTLALQESNPIDLPQDTSTFNDLVSNYESITQDVITGQVTLSSGLSSMYTLLSASLSSISNSSLANACINAYNAFLNKLSLFQSSGGSSTSYTYTTVQTLQSTLDTYYQSFSGGSITYDQMLSTAAGALSTSVSSATSTQEIISLNNVYRSFLSRVGATLDSSSYSQDVIDGFNDTLDDYTDGSLSRSQALSSLKSDYRTGIAGTSSAVDVAAITAAYQASVDQIATSEFTLSTSAGQVSAEAIELEDSIIDEFDYVSLSAMLDFQNWQFFPDQEANLYREYFQRFFSESDSPFYAFLYYPLVLGVAGLILGTGIRFAVRARKSRGSSNSQGGDT